MSRITFSYAHIHPTDPSRLLVFLDGVQSSGVRPGLRITEALEKRHPLVTSFYKGFNKKRFVRTIYEYICNHEGTVAFIGLSAGALLAHDVIEYAQVRGMKKVRFEIILIDGLTGLRDMVDQGAKFVPFIPPIPTPGWISRRIFGSDEPIQHEEGLDELEEFGLNVHVLRSHRFSLRGWVQQVRYPVKHPGPRRDVLEGVNIVSIVSLHDKFVRQPDAHQHWEDAADREILHIVAQAPGHCLLLEFPSAYLKAILAALDHLDEMADSTAK